MLAAVFAMGVHSTFFGPIKYAILPQHLQKDEVLGGTGLVEAGTYIAILGGHHPRRRPRQRRRARGRRRRSIALLGYLAGRQVPPAPPAAERVPFDWHIIRASIRAGQRDPAHPAPVPRDPRDQLLLDDRRGADHHLPAAGEERARRRRAGREPVHRHLLGRHRDRLGR